MHFVTIKEIPITCHRKTVLKSYFYKQFFVVATYKIRKIGFFTAATNLKMVKMASTAFLLTYEWRCSRQERIAGMSGSISSGSFNLHRKRSVEPRMNSFGCCKSCTYNKTASHVKLTSSHGSLHVQL